MQPTHLVYFNCGHAALQAGKHPTAILELAPSLDFEAINRCLIPELRGRVKIMAYPAKLCTRCYPNPKDLEKNVIELIKAQLHSEGLPIPSDEELSAQVKQIQERSFS